MDLSHQVVRLDPSVEREVQPFPQRCIDNLAKIIAAMDYTKLINVDDIPIRDRYAKVTAEEIARKHKEVYNPLHDKFYREMRSAGFRPRNAGYHYYDDDEPEEPFTESDQPLLWEVREEIAVTEDALTEDQGIAVGEDALTEDQGIAVGEDALTVDQGIAVGEDALTEDQGIAVGEDAFTGRDYEPAMTAAVAIPIPQNYREQGSMGRGMENFVNHNRAGRGRGRPRGSSRSPRQGLPVRGNPLPHPPRQLSPNSLAKEATRFERATDYPPGYLQFSASMIERRDPNEEEEDLFGDEPTKPFQPNPAMYLPH